MGKIQEKGIILVLALGLAGCSSMPGSDKQQGAVIGGATGAAVGAAVSKENRALGAVIGGAVGAAGGYVIGANKDKITGKDSDEAQAASRRAEEAPVTAQQAQAATSADVNSDGFVTLDEVVALESANLTDEQIIERLRTTKQVFELTPEQKRYLLDKGVSQNVVDQLGTLNREQKDQLPSDSVIGRKPGTAI
jgi:hypothetical protein